MALQKIILSLAKNRREIDGPLAHASIPFIVPSSTDFLIRAERPTSPKKKKKKRNKGRGDPLGVIP